MLVNTIKKLKLENSFLQLNTIKGYLYIDKAGSILNSYINESKPFDLQFNMSINGLIIDSPSINFDKIKITSDSLWFNLKKEKLDFQFKNHLDLYLKEAKWISEKLSILKYSRFGWRNHFIHEFEKDTDQQDILKKIFPMADVNVKLNNFCFSAKVGNINCTFIVSVLEDPENSDLIKGLLIDIDQFYTKEIGFSAKDIQKLKDEFQDSFKPTGEILSFINKIIS